MAIIAVNTDTSPVIKENTGIGYRGDGKAGEAKLAYGKSTGKAGSIFSGSPIGTKIDAGPDLTDDKSYRDWFFNNVVKAKINDSNYGLGNVDLTFGGNPDGVTVAYPGKLSQKGASEEELKSPGDTWATGRGVGDNFVEDLTSSAGGSVTKGDATKNG